MCTPEGFGGFLTPVAVRVSTRSTQGPVSLTDGLAPRGELASQAAGLLGTEPFQPCLTAPSAARHAKV